MTNYKYYLSFLLSCGFLFQGIAQETLSLSQAIETGLKNNFQILIAEKNTDIATNNNSWGEAGLYPTVNFRLSQSNRRQEQNNPTSFVQGSLFSSSIAPNLDVAWTLFQGFQVSISKERFAQLQEQSQGNVQVVIENTIQAITLAYYRCLIEQQKLKIVEKTFQLSKDRFDYLQSKKELGVATTFEVLQEKNAYLNDSLNVVNQAYNITNTQRNLNLLLALDSETQYEFPSNVDVPTTTYQFEELQKKMLESNQSLQNQYINLAILKQNIALQKSFLYPSVSLNLGTNYNGSYLARDGDAITGNSNDFYANFTLNFTLFNGGKTKRAIENSKIQEEIGNLQKEELSLNLKNQLRNFYEQYNLQQQRYNIQLETQKTTQLNLDLAQERFKTGLINSFDFRTIQLSYLNTELQLLEQSYQIINVETEITRLIGGYIQ